ncbi:MAG: hypothetical protein ACE5EM_11955 [Sphingomonadales bacterium]
MVANNDRDREGTPVIVAAARLGLSPDALRKRIKRGTVAGFIRDGRVFVDPEWLDKAGYGPGGGQQRNGPESTQALLELQRTELSRLLRDNAHLNERIDRLLHVQEREQVLRQQMQNMIERLSERQALAPPPAQNPDLPRIEQQRARKTETDLNALKSAVADLVAHLERRGSG